MSRNKQEENNKKPAEQTLAEEKADMAERKAAMDKKNADKLAKIEAEKKAAIVEEKATPKKWVFAGNLKHNGTRYEKGAECPTELLKEFKLTGYVEAV